jgi:hypothetical protein
MMFVAYGRTRSRQSFHDTYITKDEKKAQNHVRMLKASDFWWNDVCAYVCVETLAQLPVELQEALDEWGGAENIDGLLSLEAIFN